MSLNLSAPGLTPPAGVEPQFDNPPNRNDVAIPIIIICIIVCSILFPLRLYSKYLSKEFHWRDLVTGLAFASYWPYIYYTWGLTYTSGGYMVHQWNIRLGELSDYNYLTFVAILFYIVVVTLVKIGILLEFTAIFVPTGTRNYFFWISHITIGIILIWNIVGFILFNVRCTPYSGNWDPLAAGLFCRFDIAQQSVGSAVVNVVFDLVPLFLPQKIIWGLNASWKKKSGVSLIFLVGLLGIASALTRLIYSARFSNSTDTTYFYSLVGICSFAEVTCGMVILCVPFTPKALASLAQTSSQVFASRKSWTSSLFVFRKSDASKTRGSSWNAGSGSKTSQRGLYQKFDKQPSDTMHLTPRYGQPGPAAITCETRISITEEFNPGPRDTDGLSIISPHV